MNIISLPVKTSSEKMPRWTAPVSFLSLKGFYQYYVTYICVVIFALPLILAPGADAAPITENLQRCLNAGEFDSNTNYFPQRIELSAYLVFSLVLCVMDHGHTLAVKMANDPTSNLAYTYANSYKVITNSLSNETLVLYQCGAPRPTVAGATRFIPVPVTKVAISDTSAITYLELLGVRNTIKMTLGGAEYITSPCIQAQANTADAVIDVNTRNQTAGRAQLASVDVVFHYFSNFAASANNSVAFPATADPGVVRRVQWLGFLASFYNLEATANTITNSILGNYNCIASNINTTTTTRPKVALVQYEGPSDFNNQTATWQISADQFEIDFVTAAGGSFFSSNVTGGIPRPVSFTSAADFTKAIADVDILIDGSFASTVLADVYKAYGLSDASTNFKFVANKQIWMGNRLISPNGGYAYFESAVILNNVVLADLAAIIHPELLPASKYTPTYFRNLYTSPTQVTLTAADCKAPTGALALQTLDCPAAFSSATGGKSAAQSDVRTGSFAALAAGAAAACMLWI
ncbi:hypothetical protein HDV05_006547 [Chytridiales sp. JEL 0842]|nr:hypothetical protein HDV05_006547 [Chytridiales sp. JEL 0842]